MKLSTLATSLAIAATTAAQPASSSSAVESLPTAASGDLIIQHLRQGNDTYGPPLEIVHYYTKQWPIGLAVSSTGRIFSCYTRGSYDFTLGEVSNLTSETPFPANRTLHNLPVEQLNTTFNSIPFGSSRTDGLISVQALVISNETPTRPETLWILDTGRPTIHTSSGEPVSPYAQPGGPKVVAVNITAGNDTAYRTYTFPPDVHYPDSFLNDIRIDLRPSLSDTSGHGVAYLVDSSNEGRPGFIVLDLGTGESWRRLSLDPSVLRVQENVPSYNGVPFYLRTPGGNTPIGYQQEALDGIQLSPDGERIYYSPLTSTELYSVPASNLRVRPTDPLAELMAHSNISSHGQRGAPANGFEGDSQRRIYQCMPTVNAIYYYDERDLQTHAFVRDPRIQWPDTINIGQDGYLYMNINQLFYQPDWNAGHDLRQLPGAIFRVKLPHGAGKINLA